MDSETLRRLKYAARLHWNDPAYLLGCLSWLCSGEVAYIDDTDQEGIAAAQARGTELLEIWQGWMRKYPDLRAKRVARWSESDELALATRLRLTFEFIANETKPIAMAVEYTKAFTDAERLFALEAIAAIEVQARSLVEWISQRELKVNEKDALDEIEPVQ